MEIYIGLVQVGWWLIIGIIVALFAFLDDDYARHPKCFDITETILVFALSAIAWPVTLYLAIDWYRTDYTSDYHFVGIVWK